MKTVHRVAINGAAGRVGQRLIHLIHVDPEATLVGAVEWEGSPLLGSDAGLVVGLGEIGVPLTTAARLPEKPDSLIDFSNPAGAQVAVEYCLAEYVPLVMATTGLEPDTIQALQAAAATIPVVWSPNMSLAVNLGMKLVELASATFARQDGQVDVEIIERHHRYKADSPSGTALKFGEIVTQQMGQSQRRHGREGMVGQRPAGEIGYHAVRSGDHPGQHTIQFGLLGETLEIKVSASNRDCYALGAITAAKFASQQPPGLYTMMDVLGL